MRFYLNGHVTWAAAAANAAVDTRGRSFNCFDFQRDRKNRTERSEQTYKAQSSSTETIGETSAGEKIRRRAVDFYDFMRRFRVPVI
jgi:hypothetical protein